MQSTPPAADGMMRQRPQPSSRHRIGPCGRRARARTGRTPTGIWLLLPFLCLLPDAAPPAAAQSGQDILDEVRARHLERVAGVTDYTVVQDVMDTRATVHFEKVMRDGFPTFVPVSMFTVLQELLDSQRMSFVEAAAQAGLRALASELSAASYSQLGGLLGAAEEIGSATLPVAAGESPLEAVRSILARSAGRAGLEAVAEQVGGARAEQLTAIAGALTGLGEGSVLGQLGKVALGEAKNLAIESLATAVGGPVGTAFASLVQGNAAGGLGGLFGSGGGGSVGQQAVGGLASAGMAALMGGVSTIVTQAMMPDLSQLDLAGGRMLGPDLYELLQTIGDNVDVAGSESIDGHDVWILDVRDVSALALRDANGFTAGRVTLHVDRRLHVLRAATIAGEVEVDGKTVPVVMETRLEDYRDVAGLLHPFRSTTSIRGLDATMSPEEREQLARMPAEMREKLAQMQEQLAKMPPQQRAMAEQMLKQQIPQFEQMLVQLQGVANPEETDITVVVRDLQVNEGRPEALRTRGPSR